MITSLYWEARPETVAGIERANVVCHTHIAPRSFTSAAVRCLMSLPGKLPVRLMPSCVQFQPAVAIVGCVVYAQASSPSGAPTPPGPMFTAPGAGAIFTGDPAPSFGVAAFVGVTAAGLAAAAGGGGIAVARQRRRYVSDGVAGSMPRQCRPICSAPPKPAANATTTTAPKLKRSLLFAVFFAAAELAAEGFLSL